MALPFPPICIMQLVTCLKYKWIYDLFYEREAMHLITLS